MAKTAALHLEGVVDHVLYCNAENGYTVLELDAGSALVTVVGEIGEVEEGESLILEGEYVNHPGSGRSFVHNIGSESCRQTR